MTISVWELGGKWSERGCLATIEFHVVAHLTIFGLNRYAGAGTVSMHPFTVVDALLFAFGTLCVYPALAIGTEVFLSGQLPQCPVVLKRASRVFVALLGGFNFWCVLVLMIVVSDEGKQVRELEIDICTCAFVFVCNFALVVFNDICICALVRMPHLMFLQTAPVF